MPSGFASARHPLHRPANRAAVHAQTKTVLEYGGHIAMRHPQALVHPDCQRQGIRTELHGHGSQCIGGLTRISPLHALVAHAAAPDGNIKAPPDRLAHHLVLVLRFDLLHGQGASAATLRGQRHGDDFIHLFGYGFAVTLAVSGAGLTPWWLWVGFPPTAGKRSGLSFLGPLSFLQLALQPVILLAYPFLFLMESSLLLMQLFFLSPQLLVFSP